MATRKRKKKKPAYGIVFSRLVKDFKIMEKEYDQDPHRLGIMIANVVTKTGSTFNS